MSDIEPKLTEIDFFIKKNSFASDEALYPTTQISFFWGEKEAIWGLHLCRVMLHIRRKWFKIFVKSPPGANHDRQICAYTCNVGPETDANGAPGSDANQLILYILVSL